MESNEAKRLLSGGEDRSHTLQIVFDRVDALTLLQTERERERERERETLR
jgi:hypothetical protein